MSIPGLPKSLLYGLTRNSPDRVRSCVGSQILQTLAKEYWFVIFGVDICNRFLSNNTTSPLFVTAVTLSNFSAMEDGTSYCT
ncbi:uncharacterized protein METZ01_LOCUS333992 [marine metagenome]|uniref:Uncharacterized protein n=1 Tax=marine metagenome TaxID=408172 RepID=A0A382Q881_9ZZZZ